MCDQSLQQQLPPGYKQPLGSPFLLSPVFEDSVWNRFEFILECKNLSYKQLKSFVVMNDIRFLVMK